MDLLLAGVLVIFVLGLINVTGSLRVIRDSSERTAAATEALLELEPASNRLSELLPLGIPDCETGVPHRIFMRPC